MKSWSMRSRIGHSHVLAPELRTRDGAYAVVQQTAAQGGDAAANGEPVGIELAAEREVRGAEGSLGAAAQLGHSAAGLVRRARRWWSARTTKR